MTNRRNFLVSITLAAGAVSFVRPFNALANSSATAAVNHSNHKLVLLHVSNLKGQAKALAGDSGFAEVGGLENVVQIMQEMNNEAAAVFGFHTGDLFGQKQSAAEQAAFLKTLHAAGIDCILPGENTTQLADLIKDQQSVYQNELFSVSFSTKGSITIACIHIKVDVGEMNSCGLKGLASKCTQTAELFKANQSCNLVVATVTGDKKSCIQLAQLSTGIDTLLTSVSSTTNHCTEIIRNKANDEVMLSYAGENGSMVSRIEIAFNDNKEKMLSVSKPVFPGVARHEYASVVRKLASSIA